MREAIGGTWIFTIVIVFIVLFTGFLAISVNYSKAFKVKNGIVSLIEKHEGMNNDTEAAVKKYLSDMGYIIYNGCSLSVAEQGTSAVLKGFEPSLTDPNKYKYCVSKVEDDSSYINKSYYKVTVFFRLDLPIFGSLFTFPITGETKPIYFPKNDLL